MKSIYSRTTALILAAAMLLSFTGCLGGKTVLNGTDIGKYTIVYSADQPDYTLRAAEYIQAQILERTGKEVPIQESLTGPYDHEIVVGETNRPLSFQLDAETENVEFAILSDGNHVAMEGDYFIIAAAAYFFVETYLPGKSFNTTVPQEVSIHAPITEKPNNFIFLIGDGMGFNQTLMYDYMEIPIDAPYHDNEDIFYGYYLPYQGQVHTNSLSGTTDSAASATALACGYKTTNHYVGKDGNLNDVQSLTELAASLGKATAVMSTDLQTGATPAGFSAHAEDRDDSHDILDCQVRLMQDYGTVICCDLHSTDYYQDDITEVLDKMDQSETGFFLMYEEGYIDKFSHSNNAYDTFFCLVRFNQAIGLFMEYAFYHPDTFLIITADHETGGLRFSDDGECIYMTESHTSTDVPIFGYGQGAEVFQNFADENTKIPQIIASMWGVEDFGDQSN